MTDKLNMSLEQIIQKTEVRSRAKPVPVKSSASRRAVDKFDRRDRERGRDREGDRDRVRVRGREDRPGPPQPLKEVIVARPKIITAQSAQPTAAATTAKSTAKTNAKTTTSVFSRLGPAGALVIFKNLAPSVKQEDVSELCKAVGAVREVSFLKGFDGLGQARAHFNEKKTAQACVQKYHGLTLDGLEMQVVLDQSAAPVFVVGAAEQRATAAKTDNTNVRAGLFGTALDAEPARTVTLERKRNKGRNERRPLRK